MKLPAVKKEPTVAGQWQVKVTSKRPGTTGYPSHCGKSLNSFKLSIDELLFSDSDKNKLIQLEAKFMQGGPAITHLGITLKNSPKTYTTDKPTAHILPLAKKIAAAEKLTRLINSLIM